MVELKQGLAHYYRRQLASLSGAVPAYPFTRLNGRSRILTAVDRHGAID